jgi:hypothetical protein
MLNIVPIVQAAPSAPEAVSTAFAAIAPGSVAVAVAHDGGVVVDYEGGIYTRPADRAPSTAERVEYALRAAGRAVHRYPTVARFRLPDWQHIRIVGAVDVATWAVSLRPPEPLLLKDSQTFAETLICQGEPGGSPCPSAVAGRFPGLRVLATADSADMGKPGDLFPACGLQQLRHLGHWQAQRDERYPDKLLPLRLFKCGQGCWLVIPGLRHDSPAVFWPQ